MPPFRNLRIARKFLVQRLYICRKMTLKHPFHTVCSILSLFASSKTYRLTVYPCPVTLTPVQVYSPSEWEAMWASVNPALVDHLIELGSPHTLVEKTISRWLIEGMMFKKVRDARYAVHLETALARGIAVPVEYIDAIRSKHTSQPYFVSFFPKLGAALGNSLSKQ